MQLVAYGSQDVYLTGNPQITFWKAVYKRHTNFALENIQQVFNGSPQGGQKSSVTVSRNGDLVHQMYLRFTQPQFVDTEAGQTAPARQAETARASWAAEQFVSEIEMSIGGQRIDRHTREWFRLYDNLYNDASKKRQWEKLTCTSSSNAQGALGTGAQELGTLVLPLIFSFNRHPGLALPLIALQYHEVKIDVSFTQQASGVGPLNQTFTTTVCPTEMWANYVYLDTDERRRFAQNQHEYLIEQLQVQSESVDTKQNNVRLNFNHPVKELVWCAAQNGGSMSNANATYGAFHSVHEQRFTGEGASAIANSNGALGGGAWTPVVCPADVDSHVRTVINTQVDGWSESGLAFSNSQLGMEAMNGLLDTAKIQLNGHDRFSQQGADFFNGVQPYQHHSGSPSAGIYVYSFALNPEDHQPSGTCNFSRIDNATLVYTPRAQQQNLCSSSQLHIYATNYNVLRVMSGMGGLAYSN